MDSDNNKEIKEIKEIDVAKLIEDFGYEDVLIFTNPSYSTAFLGVSEDNRAVYDYNKMIEYLVNTDNITYNEAMEFIDYNTIRALPYYENTPVILYKFF